MKQPIPSYSLLFLLTTLVASGPLATDLYLPALPTIVKAFDSNPSAVQLTLSVFLAGFACGQIIYGALSDRFGRRPLMLGGMLIYCLASLACVFAASIEALVALRFVQALGACAGPVLGRAIVRDLWGATDSARIIAYLGSAMAIAPLFAPTLGGIVTAASGWQANFILLTILSLAQIVAVSLWLPESNVHRHDAALDFRQMVGNFGRLLRDRRYLGYLSTLSFSFSALFAFISASSFLLIDGHGLSPHVYGMSFGVVVAGYLLGSLISGRLVRRRGSADLLRKGVWLGALAGATMLALEWAGVRSLPAILGPMFFCTAACGLVMPNTIAQALAPYPNLAGSASALMGCTQMCVAALVGVAVGSTIADHPGALAVAVALCTGLALLSHGWLTTRTSTVRTGPPR
ncbi:MAG TPA: multidrug effflux MFS transporter [Accumulibacter sp.]|nr:multidrug effflux MFS transporter [Accumulibacter sp.]HMW16394.1 multidrug effflux MFS transporter [Accumulibacter sp.]HMX23251.1 multidrug effflux MFS transporter [Accumulibacter sp.]HMY07755.1 multidrug effflux MFS transporter [Accumulibacter sp.]HND79509.1 multidrug effflux MFS transporter [Accumulibacter sp.]